MRELELRSCLIRPFEKRWLVGALIPGKDLRESCFGSLTKTVCIALVFIGNYKSRVDT
jgi:hypothetical protein